MYKNNGIEMSRPEYCTLYIAPPLNTEHCLLYIFCSHTHFPFNLVMTLFLVLLDFLIQLYIMYK